LPKQEKINPEAANQKVGSIKASCLKNLNKSVVIFADVDIIPTRNPDNKQVNSKNVLNQT
jgi:hypothetical protein